MAGRGARGGADAIVGVSLFSDQAPQHFDTFCRGFVSMFRITSGRCRAERATSDAAKVG